MKQNVNAGVLYFRDWLRQHEDDPTPLYIQLANGLRSLIQDGKLKVGEALPSERSIAEMTSLSRVTIRKGIELLVREGLLRQRRGSGTYVTGAVERIEQPLARLTSFSEDMISYGRRPSVRWIAREYARPSAREAMALGLSPGEDVVRLHRIRLADDLPLAVELAVVPAKYIPSLDQLGDSLYEALARANAHPDKALQRMHACALPPFEAQLLEADAGEPALHIERISRTKAGTAVEFTRSYYKGDRFDFVVELTLPRQEAPPEKA